MVPSETSLDGDAQSAALRAELETIRARLARVEQALGLTAELAPSRPERGHARAADSRLWLGHFAWACFVLGGALVLRALTHQGWVAAAPGMALGIGYGLLLIAGPHLLARSRGSRTIAGVQVCGVIVVGSLVLEMVHHGPLSVPAATGCLLALAAVGTVVGVRQQQATLVAATLLSSLIAAAGLGLTPAGAIPRAALLAGLGAGALAASARLRRPLLRPLLLLPLAVVVSGAVIVTGHRPELPRTVGAALVLAAALVSALQIGAALVAAAPDRWERLASPLALAWVGALALFASPGLALPACAGLGALLLCVARLLDSSRAGMAVLGGALLLALALPLHWLGPPLLGVAALWLQRLAGRERIALLASHGLLLLGVAAALHTLSPPLPDRVSGLLAASGVLGVASLLHAWVGSREELPLARRLAPISLAGLLMLAMPASVIAGRLHGHAAAGLTSNVVLAIGSVLCRLLDRRLPGAARVGTAGLALLAGKVLLWDLSGLDGGYRIASVLALGVTALAASLLRPRP